MSTNEPYGQGQSDGPQQNPYGQAPQGSYGQPGYGPPPPQSPYDQPFQQQPPHQQQPPYGQQPPYAPPQQPLPPWLAPASPYGGPPAPGSRVLASPGDRFLARLIDTAVLLIPLIVVGSVVMAVNPFLYYVVVAVLILGYEAGMTITQNGQTIGKKAMKIRVVALGNGGRPTDAEYWTRAAVFAGPQALYLVGSLFSLVDVLWQLWDKPLQQCLHDKAGKTVVVKES
ncbi:hypothetical protein GCM10009760_52430 [Kitasatospora kazusensis]|uniref:RDD domain-containing protein n=1 Tax=Kitasatospora kazusensis TaxID=407974 RepID=A0ABP5LZB6_9ACTN